MKVLIADDETMICEWLQFCIAQSPVCQLAGVAHNGREALELCRKTDPDLVLTDIKMPVMDGLELLHALRAAGSTARVVILTAFAEFDMARQAIRDGADEYLLKTEMQNDTLQELLARMAAESTLQADKQQAGAAQAHAIIRNILRRESELTEQDLAELRRCGIRWRDNGLFAMAVWKRQLMGGGLVFPQDDQIRHVAGFDYSDRVYVAVGNMHRALSRTEKTARLLAYARAVQQTNGCMVGVSGHTDSMTQIPALARQAAYSLAQGFYTGENRLYEPQQPPEVLTQQVNAWKAAVTALRVRLYQQAPGQQADTVEAFLQDTCRRCVPAVELVMKFCADVFELFALEAAEAGAPLPAPDETRAQLAQCVRMDEAAAMLLEAAHRCAPAQPAARPRSKAVLLAVEYMRANFQRPISLEQVAGEVYLNPEYFSRIFREEMGVTFITFLTELRLNRSVQLLEETAMRVQDIARETGYPNVSYFSTTFKKKYGVSPYEYRRKN